ncbi:MAG TPA: TIGR01244 family sulfur transferase [Xanthobacteraceae bacterium]|nr:TIGR01244 family sulfur transferase [Xanthobacteraceae bacterium]
MQPVKINDKLSVAKQPALDDFPRLASAGFQTLINNRPDGEDAAQPGTAAEESAAAAAGMAYSHIPVTGPTLTREAVQKFRAEIDAAEGPVLAHCKGGTRSLTLWAISEVIAGNMRRDEVVEFGRSHGFDLAGAAAWLERNGY